MINTMEKPQTLKGFRDFLPAQMRVRNYVISVLRPVFEKYGFEPLETPTLEYASILLNKYGEEADRLVYTFKDRGGRKVGLNYDLTVSTSRVLAQYANEIKLPFRRYQIQRAYRAENTQKGRYREFVQCDIDIFGSNSPYADSEILAVIYESLIKLGLKDFNIQVNSRQVLFKLLEDADILETSLKLSVLLTLDKLEKIGWEGVSKELAVKGVDETQVRSLQEALERSEPDENLKELLKGAILLGVPEKVITFCPSLSRGLDYYTGVIYETVVNQANIGSVTGGGRYDNLIKQLGGPDIPATGTTLGLDRLCDVIAELGLIPDSLKESTVKVLVCQTGDNNKVQDYALSILKDLRQNNVSAEMYLDLKPLDKQLKYAVERDIPQVVIIGENEVTEGKVTIKDLTTREQKTILKEELKELFN